MMNKGVRIASKPVHNEELKSFMKQWIGEHDFYLFTPDDNQYGWVDEPKASSAKFFEIIKKHNALVYVEHKPQICNTLESTWKRKNKRNRRRN